MSDLAGPPLLLVDDDPIFCAVLARALTARGYTVHIAHDASGAEALARACLPLFAVVDLNLSGASGLALVPVLHQLSPEIKILVLTGYASIATAVEAIKLGATHYLPKPADADEILAALLQNKNAAGDELVSAPLPLSRVEWEHIQKVLSEHEGNVSATARALKMHRRTLQRKLAKRPQRG